MGMTKWPEKCRNYRWKCFRVLISSLVVSSAASVLCVAVCTLSIITHTLYRNLESLSLLSALFCLISLSYIEAPFVNV